MSKNNPAKGVVWDLSDFYSGIADPKIKSDKKAVEKLAVGFTKKYKGKINSEKLTAKFLLQAIKDLESLEEKLSIYGHYAHYLHSQDALSPKIGAFFQEANEYTTKIGTGLLWFSLEIQQLPQKQANHLIKSPLLKNYKHYLKHLRVFTPFKKSLNEEEILTKMSQTGGDAFVRFYDEKSASETFKFKNKKLGYAQLASIMADDPKVENRKLASKSYTKNYIENQKFYSYVLNTLLLDKKIEDEIRGHQYPQQSTFLSYEVDPDIVKALVKTIEHNYSLCERYYIAKSKLLKRKLYEWDRYSKIYYQDKTEIPWEKAKEIVISSFSEFDKDFGDIAKRFFDKGWIDAEISSTKRGGAFCSYCVPSMHPSILLSYTGKINDVMTLAHELGHGIHAYISRGNSLANYSPSTATAEIASVFCESVVFDKLYSQTTNKREKIDLLANKIQGSFATIFRQVLFYIFETKIHEHRRKKGELSVDDFNNYFQKGLQKMFKNGLTLTAQHKYWWMPILHFYHYNFYVFTYAFGEALTLALYQKYKLEGEGFVKNYKGALAKGGSVSPKEITALMGVNISDPKFWQKGIDLLAEYVTEFEDLVVKP